MNIQQIQGFLFIVNYFEYIIFQYFTTQKTITNSFLNKK